MMPVDAGSRAMRAGSQLEKVLASGGFAVTAEIHPPASADPSSIERQAAMYRGLVDACNVTDGQRALVRISSLAAATLVLQSGIEPIMQMVLRDRNRIGIQADLLGASALGIRNVLCLWGDPPTAGNEKDAKPVYDLTTEEMIATFRVLRDAGTLRGGDAVQVPPKVFIGAAADPFRGSKEESFAKLRAKVTAGADFVQTQGVYDVDRFEDWMRLVRKEWLHEKVYILAGVIPLKSPKMARFMAEKLGAVIPKQIMDRMERAPNPKAEGLSIAMRTVKALKRIDGVSGVHIMPVGWEDIVPQLVKEAGLFPRPEPAAALV
ncbi:MAG TPA: methylenetetrahydrofolate reductase [Thermoplasmata archaeon]|nr:methylenetetrahydrofolate reductase [Thermoplasmata archaeon]